MRTVVSQKHLPNPPRPNPTPTPPSHHSPKPHCLVRPVLRQKPLCAGESRGLHTMRLRPRWPETAPHARSHRWNVTDRTVSHARWGSGGGGDVYMLAHAYGRTPTQTALSVTRCPPLATQGYVRNSDVSGHVLYAWSHRSGGLEIFHVISLFFNSVSWEQ